MVTQHPLQVTSEILFAGTVWRGRKRNVYYFQFIGLDKLDAFWSLAVILLTFKLSPSSYWFLSPSDMIYIVINTLSSMTRHSRFILYFSCPDLRSAISSKSPGSFQWEMTFGNLSGSTCYWVGHYFWAFPADETKKYVHIYIFIYLSYI